MSGIPKVVVGLALVALTTALPRYEDDSQPRIWAVLVAGSSGYFNYRHQADVCHSYQILHKRGIPDERIVVMMYDDVANSTDNPTKGILINHPDGSDVYAGVPKDYTGDQVTSQNFLKILRGDQQAMKGVGTGKVIQSGPEDHVFVFFADHGGPGLVAFPNDYLYSTDLVKTLTDMHSANRFSKLVFYMEACESGSMFENLLPANVSIFATTASSADESSYACYYDDVRQTYLGDVYSVKWMEDSDAEDLSQETLETQFSIVKKETTTSAVHQYGDLNLAQLVVSQFQGEGQTSKKRMPRAHLDAVNSRDVPIAIIKKKIDAAYDETSKTVLQKDLNTLLRNRNFLKNKVVQITKALGKDEDIITNKVSITHHKCYRKAVQHFHENCFSLTSNPFSLGLLGTFVNLCETGVRAGDIMATMDSVCTHPKVVGIV